jgi:group I intron endonuclease
MNNILPFYFINVLIIFLIILVLYFSANWLIQNLDLLVREESFLLLNFLPIKIYKDLTKPENLKSELHNIGGVYGLINISNPNNSKQYIGSSKNLFERLMDHLKGRDSNIRLQRSISKYGIQNFYFVIYYFHKNKDVILTDIETEVIKSFLFENLYNLKREATSLIGYKHTLEAKQKMKNRFLIKSNHPMFGKNHDKFALSKISKPGILNPMFGKIHTLEAKQKMSLAKSKIQLGLFDIDKKLLKIFINQVELAKYLNLHKSTISRYFKSGNLLLKKYFIRKINK